MSLDPDTPTACWRCGLPTAPAVVACPHCAARRQAAGGIVVPPARSDAEPVRDLTPEPTACWRCGLKAAADLHRCPYCEARLADDAEPAPRLRRRGPPREPGTDLNAMLIAYVAFLVSSVVLAIALFACKSDLTDELENTLVGLCEVVDLAILLTALACRGPLRIQPPTHGQPLVAWWTAGPVLGLLLLINLGYFEIWRAWFPMLTRNAVQPITALTIILGCVQPAIVEELFFRQFVLGSLGSVMRPAGANVVTAALFALAHLYNPLGMPYLFLAGWVFGYYRQRSGSLALPMLLHFCHNLVIALREAA